jgi:hypothetical protein
MVGSRIASTLKVALAVAAFAGATSVLVSAPAPSHASATGPATCLPRCGNALYPFVESVRATGDEVSTSADTMLPGIPPSGG